MTLASQYPSRSGRKFRKDKRLENDRARRRWGVEYCSTLIKDCGFTVEKIKDVSSYKEKCREITDKLNGKLSEGVERKTGKMLLRRQARKIVEENDLETDEIPKAEVLMSPVEHALTFAGFAKSSAIQHWDGHAENTLLENLRNNRANIWWALAVYSFCRDSFQLDPVWVRKFADDLATKSDRLVIVGERVAYRSRIKAQTEHAKGKNLYNVRNDDDGKSLLALEKDCFLSPATVFLVQKYRCAPKDHIEVAPGRLVQKLRDLIWPENAQCDHIKTTSDLLSAIGHQFILDPKSPLSPILVEVATGRLATIGLHPENTDALSQKPQMLDELVLFSDGGKFERPVSIETRHSKSAKKNLGQFYKDIIEATNVGHSSTETLKSIEDSIRRLIDSDGYSPSQGLVLNWIHWLSLPDESRMGSGKKTYAALTVKKYAHLLTSRWIQCVGDEDVFKFGFEDWLDAFEEMRTIEEPKVSDPENLITYLIHLFVDYVKTHRKEDRLKSLPPENVLKQLMPREGASNSFVRARIVRSDHVAILVNRLNSHSFRGQQLALMTVLGFRCGLRISECVKLRHSDFELPYLVVRRSKFGLLKSDTSERALDLYALLSETEYKLLSNYLERNPGKSGELAFPPSRGHMWAPSAAGRELSWWLKKITGDDGVVFHSLRHSAACVFHAALEDNFALAKKLSGFGRNKLKAIRASILLNENRVQEKYWHLARILGHAHFSETFRRYLHFSDHILAEKIEKGPARYGLQQLAIWQGSSDEINSRILWLQNTVELTPFLFEKSEGLTTTNTTIRIGSPAKRSKWEAMLKLLAWVEHGKSYAEGLMQYGLKEGDARKYLRNALLLYFRSKQKGRPARIFGPRPKPVRTLEGHKFMLMPYRVFGGDSAYDAKLISALKALDDKSIKASQLWSWATIFLEQQTTARHLELDKPAEGQMATELLSVALPMEDWVAEIRYKEGYEECAREYWKDLAVQKIFKCIGEATGPMRKPGGVAWLRFCDEPHLPRVLAHSIGIWALTQKDTQENCAGKIDFDAVDAVFDEIVQT